MSMIDRSLDGHGLSLRPARRHAAAAAARGRRHRADQPRHDGGARARHLVGARSVAQPRHRRAGAQSARPARRDRRRSDDATARPRLAGAAAADRGLGLSAARPSAAQPRTAARLLWLFGAVLAAAFASCLPRSAHWPLPSGLGGVIGDAMLRLPAVLFGAPLAGSQSPRRRDRARHRGAHRLRRRRRHHLARAAPDDEDEDDEEDERGRGRRRQRLDLARLARRMRC